MPVMQAVLCIDDTPDVRTLVQRLLSSRYTVLEAEDGLRGIELALAERPALILVDLHLPHLTGYEVATRLKSLLPDTPVIALTADVSAGVRQRALASGCDGYIAKPIDVDGFVAQVTSYLAGAREQLQDDSFRQAYQETLVARLEEKVRELTGALQRNEELNVQNLVLLEKARRQARLLEAGARTGRSIASILDLDALLSATVNLMREEFGLFSAGIFLLDETGGWAVLRATSGPSAAQRQRTRVGGDLPVGIAIAHRQPITGQTDEGGVELALPLVLGGRVIGVLTARHAPDEPFSDEDVAALQIVSDQLAVAIGNARLLAALEKAHQELVRSKTYEAIANATGEAIHWVGNKAAPIPGSVARIRQDLARAVAAAGMLLAELPSELRQHPGAALLARAAEELRALGIPLDAVQAELAAFSPRQWSRALSLESVWEDLEIIENSARAILNIKEDLIGPARQQTLEPVALPDLLNETVAAMGIPDEYVRTLFAADLPSVQADRVQLGRVFTNLVKNAMEAMERVTDKKLFLWARRADEPGFVVVDVIDNGTGIPPEMIDKIWMAFYTTKGDRGGTGLGLPACAQIIGQLGGKIVVESEVGVGTTFSVFLPSST